MSCSKPMYQPQKCDGQPCPGDCDTGHCPLAYEWWEDGEEDDSRVAYYERQGDEYVYYDENECELYREPA